MFRLLGRTAARSEVVTSEELLAAPPPTVLHFPSQTKDSSGDIVMMNSPRAPVAWTTLSGAGWSYGEAWPLADERSAEIVMGIVLSPAEIAREISRAPGAA